MLTELMADLGHSVTFPDLSFNIPLTERHSYLVKTKWHTEEDHIETEMKGAGHDLQTSPELQIIEADGESCCHPYVQKYYYRGLSVLGAV